MKKKMYVLAGDAILHANKIGVGFMNPERLCESVHFHSL